MIRVPSALDWMPHEHFEGLQPPSYAGGWTPEKTSRLRALVDRAHTNGLWIRFYTLDGGTEKELSCNGWFRSYNFGSLETARARWHAAMAAHADVPSDQVRAPRQGIALGANRDQIVNSP